MTRRSTRSSTGSSGRRLQGSVLCALACLVLTPPPAPAQSLRIASLDPVLTGVLGSWVSYRVRTRSGNHPVRELLQRAAVVSKEEYEGKTGYWVELKTVSPTAGTRLERGFFAEVGYGASEDEAGSGEGAEAPSPAAESGGLDSAGALPRHVLLRYQRVAAGGRLYEYPLHSDAGLRAAGEVSAFELFEFDPIAPPVQEDLGPDTLRLGGRIVLTRAERFTRYGSDQWTESEDETGALRLVLTRTIWRNPAVPVTGLARTRFEVKPVRIPRPDSLAAPSAPAGSLRTAPALDPILSWTEVELLDLGADAVPEIRGEAEPAPAGLEEEFGPGPVR